MAAKKMSQSTLTKTIILPVLSIFFTTFFISYKQPLELFPENDTHFVYYTDSDGNFEDGNSTTSLDTSNRHLTFGYTLGDQHPTPYAELIFHAHELFRPINLNKFDDVEIVLHPEESSNFKLTLYTYVPGISNEADANTHRPYTMICYPQNQQKVYRLPLREFATPTWWFSTLDLRHEDLPSTSWEKITHVSISAATQEKNVPLNITIENLRFSDRLIPKMVFALFTAVLYTVLAILFIRFRRKQKNKRIKQRLYHHGNRNSYNADEKEKLLDYLSINYCDPLLTLDKIEKELELNQFQVSEIIFDTYKMRYKQYLNLLRIEEAKKLLSTTDTPISAIAEKVGYCYSNSFSRAFRQSENITPNHYRKQHKDII